MATPLERLQRIAEAHHKWVDEHGGTDGTCIECGYPDPCPTYVWATDANRDVNATWDPIDDAPDDVQQEVPVNHGCTNNC